MLIDTKKQATESLLTINQFSRRGQPLDKVMAIVIHYLGTPGQTARQARNYWESLKSQDAMDARPDISASAHYIVDLDGSILRAVPETEKAYHCGAATYPQAARDFFGAYCTDPQSSPNRVTIGVELTHPNFDGKPKNITSLAALELVRDLCQRYSLDPRQQVLRHYDVTGPKANGVLCPLWFVRNPDEWQAFVNSI
jgi:N-acetylmuramoyl-L-alanine amidase